MAVSELVILSEREGSHILQVNIVRLDEFNCSGVRSFALARDDRLVAPLFSYA
jgi:hypothetical protein